MAKPGPQKTPTAVLKSRGSWRAKTRMDEPDRIAPDLRCPDGMSAASKKHWNEYIQVLDKMGIVSQDDLSNFRILCDIWAFFLTLIKNDPGNHKLLSSLRGDYTRTSKEFGMTPASRTAVKGKNKSNTKNDKSYQIKFG